MKISICIPQYNRIDLLVKSLRIIEKQTYEDIEVVVSDDCSTDDTVEKMQELAKSYRYPVVFHVNEKNMGYDYNYRRCIELSSGMYAVVIGNDDTIYAENSIEDLVDFLKNNNAPDLGFANFVEEDSPGAVVRRALDSRVVGSGERVAVENYNGFSFVGGLIYKREAFVKHNTSKHDGSIYSQMYLGVLMVSKGCSLFTYSEALVLKDIHFDDGSFRWSYYRDGLPKNWSEYREMDGGLPSVANVLITATEDARGKPDHSVAYSILRHIYGMTYPFWLTQYRKYGSLAAAWGLKKGMSPSKNLQVKRLRFSQRLRINAMYWFVSIAGLLVPVAVFEKIKGLLYRITRRK